ncbi:DEAD/DEAH box helicase [Wenjunlia tyrosinilytica]|uniref:Helicase n=1 Tax=Wenjunlia tyrosinilytica TaxID=1544741 RepID=A0A918E0A9_9ACTN|nr:DEAD/DEAH box helicase [Wenjunlia tyrosinilytica]GGO96533.1 helicase [Wenjunlia tyrosinilytica]
MPDGIRLRPHQVEAVDAAVRALDVPPGGQIPARGLRATVVAACGTGKTAIGSHVALRVARHGRVLVVVPTLDLLTQTVAAWRAHGHAGAAVAVCSLKEDPALWSARVRCTTSAPQLALWHGCGPVTVFATYASLEVLAEALAGTYGQKMDGFDFAVIDEAHRTSGSLGKAWAAVHDQEVIPSARRLYLTATPRIWEVRAPAAGRSREGAWRPLEAELAASMDDPRIYGPVAYRLSLADAVARGLLARYQIIVVEIRDDLVTPWRLRGEDARGEEVRGNRLGALQAAILRTAALENLNTMITFHHRTVEAQAFAEGLPAVAAKLRAQDPRLYPERIWSGWLRGEHDASHRRRVLGEFGAGADTDGVQVERAVLSNCRVLGEGVDIRAVDSVALLDPKGSAVDIVQAIGRALRQKPGQGKLATLIVPVFLERGEKPEDMLTSAAYASVVRVLEGLRAHDEQGVEMLAVPQANTPAVNPSPFIGPAPEDGNPENRLLLRFSSHRDPVTVADFVSLRVIQTERQDWARGYAALKRFHAEHGHARVPLETVAADGHPLGGWVSEQRRAFGAGTMDTYRARRLEALGMVWDVAEADWQDNLAAARAYHRLHGTLAAPKGATALDRPVGQWLSNQRRAGALDKHPHRQEALAAIDPDWNPGWPTDWQRHLSGLAALVEAGGTLAEIVPGVTYGGRDIGRWLTKQREGWARLAEGQRERLARLGVQPAPGERAPAKPRRSRADMFEVNLKAARQYREREGGLRVPRGHVETVVGQDCQEHTVRLGVWLSNIRSRQGKLTAERADALNELGITWT